MIKEQFDKLRVQKEFTRTEILDLVEYCEILLYKNAELQNELRKALVNYEAVKKLVQTRDRDLEPFEDRRHHFHNLDKTTPRSQTP